LESYIGVPLIVEGHRYGTLNFSGPEPSNKVFTARELELIQLFAYWIGAELTRSNHQKKLMSQQSIMEQMSQQARIGAWEIDIVNNSLYWSEMTKEIHELPSDYQPELATAINFYKEGESRETIQLLIQKCISEGISFEQELQLITANGNEVWVSARGRSDFENGQCIRLFGSFQDITDKMSAQHKIAEHSQRITLATDSAGIGIWELNLITDELKWDDWMFKLYGITPDTFSGAYASWEKGVHPEDINRTTEQVRQAIENLGKFDSQFRIIWPDGKIKHIKAAAILSFDDNDKPISMIGVNYDITASVENEIALTNAKEKAEIAVTAKNEFFASMSHEIRTPMNGVIGMLDLVKESPLNQEQQYRIGIADQSAKPLLSLINDVLDFSKIDANQLDLENISFNLREMAGDLAEAFAQETQHKNLELILDLVDIKESLVKGDSNRIRQIFTNLLANAIKFTEQGEVAIRISQHEYSPTHWRITVAVSDTGIGISKENQDSLFETFSQVDASTTRKYGGTGLGLTIVKKLCLCMQGSVSVESTEGQGSTFSCELIIEKSPHSLLSLPAKELQGKRVLIVENNQTCGDMIKRQLLTWNIDAHLVTTSKHALSVLTESAENSRYDLMILNHQITDIDAFSLVKMLRSSSLLGQLKIVLMTPIATQHELIDSTHIGIDGYFPKPVITKDLHQALNSLINTFEKNKASNKVTKKIAEPVDTDTDWLQGIKLLLVEDNRINQMVALGVLKKIGFSECVIAVNGQDALEKLNSSDDSQPFDFIFMDCQMPEMDGYEATRLISEGKAGERYQDIVIVAMTANAMLGDEQKCLDAGMNDYLVKPINKDRVYDTLKNFLHKGH
jgi:two-component system, sensor histidine kinase and response regulator